MIVKAIERQTLLTREKKMFAIFYNGKYFRMKIYDEKALNKILDSSLNFINGFYGLSVFEIGSTLNITSDFVTYLDDETTFKGLGEA